MRPETVSFFSFPDLESHCRDSLHFKFESAIFGDVIDPSQAVKVNHSLIEMITITMCASIRGVNDWQNMERLARMKEDWFWMTAHLHSLVGCPHHSLHLCGLAAYDLVEHDRHLHDQIRLDPYRFRLSQYTSTLHTF